MESPVVFDGQRWSNAEADRIGLVPADPTWAEEFAVEAAAIQAALGPAAVPIEHIGSTAVPGLAAKPIIDILLLAPAEWPRSTAINALQQLGYVYWAENPDPTHMFFIKGMPPFGARRTHHVHVHSAAESTRLLCFRDYLRAHPDTAAAYAQLKEQLAVAYPTNREAYTRGKDAFVADILARAATEVSSMAPGR
jgi:GrpB-like predicted nucleotidyltransferase (UPF0157 family)